MDKKLKAAIDKLMAAKQVVEDARTKERDAEEALDALCPYKVGDVVEFTEKRWGSFTAGKRRKLSVRHASACTHGESCGWYLTGRLVKADGSVGLVRGTCTMPMEGLS